MASSKVIIVFVLPVIFSIIFGSAVMADTLQKPDRELNMWPMTFSGNSSHDSDIEIIGLENQYSVSEPVQIQVKINDSSFKDYSHTDSHFGRSFSWGIVCTGKPPFGIH